MYCKQCGGQLADNAAFCGKCGTKASVLESNGGNASSVSERTEEVAPRKKNGVKIAIGVASFAFVLIIAATALIIININKNPLLSTISQTHKAYKSELNDFVNKNAIFNAIVSNTSKSYSLEFDSPEVSFELSDDKSNKILHASVKPSYPPLTIDAFLTDSRLIAGIPGIMYLEADSKNLGSALLSSMQDSIYVDIDEYVELYETLDAIDFSYSEMNVSKNLFEIPPEQKAIISRYFETLTKLADKSKYEKESSSVEIGGKTVKTDRIILTADYKAINEWLTKDLLPVLKSDKDIEEYWTYYNEIYKSMNYWYDDQSYEDLIAEFEDNIDYAMEYFEDSEMLVTIKADVYKGVIVALELLAESYDYEYPLGIKLSALGERYRLNDISLEIYDGYDRKPEATITIVGDHIGTDIISSVITVKDSSSRNSASIEWDTKKTLNNLRLKANGETVKVTLALDDKDVVAEFENISLRLGELRESISVPANTALLKDLNIDDISRELSEKMWSY